MPRPHAVILDVDGTLLLSNEAHARAFVEAARELGFPGAPFEEILRMIGMGGDKLIPRAFGFSAESEEGQALEERKGEIFRTLLVDDLLPTPGVRPLLERFRSDGLRRVVATSAKEEDLQMLLRRAGVEDLIDDCTSSSDVDRSKPDPDVVEQALELAGEPAELVVMVGDTPYDAEAARRAGVRFVGVRTGGWDEAAFTGAAGVYDDPADLLRHYEQSPFAE